MPAKNKMGAISSWVPTAPRAVQIRELRGPALDFVPGTTSGTGYHVGIDWGVGIAQQILEQQLLDQAPLLFVPDGEGGFKPHQPEETQEDLFDREVMGEPPPNQLIFDLKTDPELDEEVRVWTRAIAQGLEVPEGFLNAQAPIPVPEPLTPEAFEALRRQVESWPTALQPGTNYITLNQLRDGQGLPPVTNPFFNTKLGEPYQVSEVQATSYDTLGGNPATRFEDI